MQRWALLLLGLVCFSALASARNLKQADDHAHGDECDYNDDCHTDEYCSKGDCVLKRDDGEDCAGDEQCLSGTCHHSWVFGSSCATICKSDDDCPSSHSICNMNPYNPFTAVLQRGGKSVGDVVKRGGGEQPEQPQEDDRDDDDQDDDDDDDEDDQDDEDDDQPEQPEEDQQRKAALSKGQQPEQPEQDEDDEQDQQDRRRRSGLKSGDVEKGKKKKKDDDDGHKGGGDQQAGICVQCMEDKDCKRDEYCQRGFKKDAHSCKELGKPCATYGDCPQGEYCDSTVDRCRPYFSVLSRIFSFAR